MYYSAWADTITPTLRFRAYDKWMRQHQELTVENEDLPQEAWDQYYENWSAPKPTFEPYPKIPRLKVQCMITEKIDGTNAQIIVDEWGMVHAASRKRLLTPDDDNFGFAAWVQKHAEQLTELGPGRHYGEWWGYGIQRQYGLKEKRFHLFNAGRWTDNPERPDCCGVVPILNKGHFSTELIESTIETLKTNGSVVAPGYMHPEGVMVYVASSKQLYKVHIHKRMPK